MALETVGNWYWVVDEIEAGGGKAQLVNARLAKLMMGMVNKSDKLDAQGMNRLQRTGTLPTVWIPSSLVRDARELPRTRMVLSQQRRQASPPGPCYVGQIRICSGGPQRCLWQARP